MMHVMCCGIGMYVVHVECGLSTCVWHLSDSTKDVCQGLMLCDTLGMGLRQTSPYSTQVVGLRVDTTPSSSEK